MSKTAYRIVPIRHFTTEYYLQFLDVEIYQVRSFFIGPKVERRRETWRFVPEESHLYPSGKYLYPGWCDSRYNDRNRFDYRNKGPWSMYHLEIFPKMYPDIEEYFEQKRKRREEYLQEKAKQDEIDNNAKIIYL